jgi:hypothetical protein
MLRKLLIKEPAARLQDPEEIMQHPFFASIDWTAMM